MQEMIEKWSAALEKVEHQLRELSELPESVLVARPEPKAWSVVEIVEHLNKTSDAYIPLIRAGLDKCLSGTENEYNPGFIQKWFIQFVSPENTIKLPTIKLFSPAKKLDVNATFALFFERQQMFKHIVRDCKNKRINSSRFGSPASPLLRFTVAEAMDLQVNHELRHLGQIMRTIDSLEHS